MNQMQYRRTIGFGTSLTRTGKWMLILYLSVYILELVLEHWVRVPIVVYLQLNPIGSGHFRIWQLLTHPLIHDPYSPIAFAINCLIFYFFAGSVETALGRTAFLKTYCVAAFGGALVGLGFSGVAGFGAPFMGMLPSLLALICIFGLINPEATILLMFVIPLKAKYLSYGTIAITFLTFLAKVNPHGAYHLGGIFCGLIYYKFSRDRVTWARIHIAYLEWKLRRKRGRFHVIDGKKDDDDRPTYH